MKGVSIKELMAKVAGTLNKAIITRDVQSSATVGANANAAVTFTVPSISGYTYIGIIGITISERRWAA